MLVSSSRRVRDLSQPNQRRTHRATELFGSAEPMRSDIYILRPCHGGATAPAATIPLARSMTTKHSGGQWQQLHIHEQRALNSDNWSEGTGAVGAQGIQERRCGPSRVLLLHHVSRRRHHSFGTETL